MLKGVIPALITPMTPNEEVDADGLSRLVDIAIEESLHSDPATERGIAFSLLGCVAEYGKLGITAIDATRAQADALYRQAVAALDAAAG